MEEAMSTSRSPLESLGVEVKHIPIKRLFDLLFSLLVLVLGSPLFLFIALAIFFSSPGKVIYAQQRIGRGGKPFRCYKFRTMYADADARLHELLAQDPELRQEWEATRKLKKDPRVTPFGKLLRKSSLDEIPQFWNVLKGDLSVVGPRPVQKDEIERYFGEKAVKILKMRPGITGNWQVHGRSDTCYQRRICLDEEYIDNHSLYWDLKLIAKTIPCLILMRGAY